MALFNLIVGFNYSNLSNLTEEFFDKLSKAPKGYCPKVGWPYLKFASKYQTTC